MFVTNCKEEINESKYNISIDDSMNMVLESYINDYTIFEAVLRRDFCEATGILSEDGDKNFFATIWEKIVNAFKTLKNKISEMINNLFEKIQKHKQEKADQMVEKYKNLFSKENGQLKEFIYKCHPMKAIKVNKRNTSIPDYNGITEEIIKTHMDKMTESKKLKEEIHKECWEDKEVEKPFAYSSNLKEQIVDNITDNLDNIISGKEFKKEIIDNLKKQEDDASKKLKEVKKNKDMKKEDKDKQINLAQLYLKAINATQKETTVLVSAYLHEIAAQYKLSCKIYKSAGKWLEGKLNMKAENPKPKKKDNKVEKVKGEIIDDGSKKEPQSKEDFDKIRNSAIDESRIYFDALMEAEFFEYGI